MARRTTTIKRIDPWSVLKFGLIANVAFLLILLLGFAIVWFFVQRLGLIDQVCGIATEVGFEECGINGGNLFRAVFLLGLLAVVIQSGLMVFLAFLYNLIADLVGGIKLTIQDDAPAAVVPGRGTGGAPLSTAQRQAPTAAAAARPSPQPSSQPSPQRSSQPSSQPSSQQRPATSTPTPSGGYSSATNRPSADAGTDSPSSRPMGQPMNAPIRPETSSPSSQPPASTTPSTPDAPSGPGGGPPFRNDDLFGTPGPGSGSGSGSGS